MDNKKHTCCKGCNLVFNEENKHLFPIEKHKLKDGTYKEHYRYSRCKKCTSKRGNNYTDVIKRKFIKDIKETSPCTDCGNYYPYYVMQFDHLRDKSFNIASNTGKSKKILLDEIDKCEIVCANCHAVRTHNRREELK